jgi:serine/threonine protein kinase/tetratricopeptide (TPR) repeat protein
MADQASEQLARAERRLGSLLCGRYRLERLLGIGGMAAVYEGVHRAGNRVAVKYLHERLLSDSDALTRFRREAYVANRIGHAGALPVIDDGVAEDGGIFLVMPLLEGESLRSRWERLGSRLPRNEVAALAVRTLDVLSAAHGKGIIHRDIKPENLFLTTEAELFVLDFGIARLLDKTDLLAATSTGQALGTPAFMAPEQARGLTRNIDARTDVWAVGATMFTLLTGRLVHEGETGSEVLAFAATRPARKIGSIQPDLPEAFQSVVDRALLFDREERWGSAIEMRDALRDAYSSIEPGVSIARVELPRGVPSAPVAARPTRGDVHDVSTIAPRQTPPATGGGTVVSRSSAIRLPPSTQSFPSSGAGARQQVLRRRRSIALGAVVALLAASAGLLTVRSLSKAPIDATLRATDGATQADGQLRAPFPEIIRHLAASRRAWLDANTARAREEASAALSLDEHNAAAHLALVVAMPFWPNDETRKHFMEARAGRESFDAVEREYLEALAPAMAVPADFRGAAERLDAMQPRLPDNLVLRIALADMWTRVDELERPLGLLRDLAIPTNAPGIVLARYAGLLALHDDVDEARKIFYRCLDNDPGANVCSEMLAALELNEGRCADADRVLRKQLSVTQGSGTQSSDALLSLAYGLHRLGATGNEVGAVFDKWARTFSGPIAERNAVRGEIRIALMRGQLRDGLKLYDKLGAMLGGVDDDAELFDYTAYRTALEAELGEKVAASRTLARYSNARHGLRRTVEGDDNSIFLLALGAEFGVVSWRDWLAKRDARLTSTHVRDSLLEGKPRLWQDAFAMPATSREAAAEALGQLPRYGRVLPRMDRWFWHDGALGRAFALTEQFDAALPHFERAVASCNALEDLVQYHRVLLDFATALERHGDTSRACSMYGNMVSSWRPESGSVSSQRAADRLGRLCPSRNTSKPKR